MSGLMQLRVALELMGQADARALSLRLPCYRSAHRFQGVSIKMRFPAHS